MKFQVTSSTNNYRWYPCGWALLDVYEYWAVDGACANSCVDQDKLLKSIDTRTESSKSLAMEVGRLSSCICSSSLTSFILSWDPDDIYFQFLCFCKVETGRRRNANRLTQITCSNQVSILCMISTQVFAILPFSFLILLQFVGSF